MRLAHDRAAVAALRTPTDDAPWRALFSGCLAGQPCGVEATDYGLGAAVPDLFRHPLVHAVWFCPEDHALGTPRTMPDIHGGDGFAVLDGTAVVKDENGVDLTAAMIAGGEAMLAVARRERVELAILTDMSAACGSQVISNACRLVEHRRWQVGVGVATALLLRAGIPVVSQRDFRTLEALRARLDPRHSVDADALDHHDKDWYRGYFGVGDDFCKQPE